MTLVEQIRAIHKKHFNPEFHQYRGDIIPAMVNDLKMKFFDTLHPPNFNNWEVWWLPDSAEIRAVREASLLIETCGLRDTIPAVD